jgi:Family of unknown function (DUF6533)
LKPAYGTSLAVNFTTIVAPSERTDRTDGACNLANSFRLKMALLAYDSLLTMPLETGYIWKAKFKLGTALYLLTRYPTLLFHLGNITSGFDSVEEVPMFQCRVGLRIQHRF